MLVQALREGWGIQRPANANRLPASASGEQKHKAILVLSREPLYIEFPTSLYLKGNMAWFSPISIHWEKTNEYTFSEWKGQRGGGVMELLQSG